MKPVYDRETTQLMIIETPTRWHSGYEETLFRQNLSMVSHMNLIRSGFYDHFADLSGLYTNLIPIAPNGSDLLIPELWTLDTIVERRVFIDRMVKIIGLNDVRKHCGPYELWEDWVAEPMYDTLADYYDDRPSRRSKPMPFIDLHFLKKLEEMLTPVSMS